MRRGNIIFGMIRIAMKAHRKITFVMKMQLDSTLEKLKVDSEHLFAMKWEDIL